MKIFSGTVVGGKVELPRGALADGSAVAVLAPAVPDPVLLSSAEEQELTEAVASIRRGEFTDGADLLAELRAAKAL